MPTKSSPLPLRLGSAVRGRALVLLGPDLPTRLGMLVGITAGETDIGTELGKVRAGLGYGVGTVTDLTTTGDDSLLRKLVELDVAVGTVPTYALRRALHDSRLDPGRHLWRTLTDQAALGVDFFSVHASLDRELLAGLSGRDRVIPITSRGGALVAQLMRRRNCANPYREHFDELLDLAAEHHITLSFVSSFRAGSVADSGHALHDAELRQIAELVERTAARGVQTIVELVNHVPLNLIPAAIHHGRHLFPKSALGALGPTPTDIAVGLDDVAGAIGAATAAAADIDWVNLVTAGEHSHLPTAEETRRALRSFALALHIGCYADGRESPADRALSEARARNDWPTMAGLAIDPALAACTYAEHGNVVGHACSMCGPTCPLVKAAHGLVAVEAGVGA